MRALFFCLTLIVAGLAAPPAAAQKVELSVDASKAGAKIDRQIFGQFAEHLGKGVYEGVWVGPGSSIPNTRGIRNDVVAVLNLNSFARHADRVRIANIAQMVNVLQAMILTDKEKMLLTPTYHVFKMYVPFQDATFVPVAFDAGTYTHGDITLPRVDAVAAKGTDGRLWLALTNVDPNRPAEIEARLSGVTATSAAGETLTAPKVDSVNTFEAPQTVAPRPVSAKVQGGKLALRLEPKSVTVISVGR